ncbi:Dehydrogenase citC [Exophiala dermatitidis]
MYVRPAKNCVDSWEAMGNKGWGWEGLAPYFRKHQTLDKTPVHEDPQFMPIAGGDKFHGNDGPIHTSFNDWYMPLEVDFAKAAYEVTGTKKTIHDAWSGDHMGFYSSLGAVNRSDDPGNRSYAATGYLRPNLNRPNLKVLTEAQATRIILDGNTAKGVEFLYRGTKKYSVYATREVILSAGVIQSPQLLELSGIGDPEVLSAAGVECVVENKAVGANFQDHVLGGLLFDLKPGIDSMDALRNEQFMKMQQEVYQKTQKGPYASPGMMMGFVSYASLVSPEELENTIREIEAKSLAKNDFEKAQEKVIVDQLRDPTFANLQTFCIPCRLDVAKGSDQTQFFGAPPTGKQQVSLLMCLEHPLSRGTVHITTSDPLAPPRIDPGYFRNEVDAKILAAGMAWMDRVARHPLLAKSLADRELPPQDQNMDTQEKWVDYVKNHISTQYHLIGTCALGQAVDNQLRVKGVNGLRVVDASVFPGHVSGNIMATTYAVAEKGADLIKADI